MWKLFKTLLNASALWFCLCLPSVAQAIEFRSVVAVKAVSMDTPLVTAKKVYIFSLGNPVEVIVDLGEWLKVRDQSGNLSWLESKHLSRERTVLLLQTAELKATPSHDAKLLASVEKNVVLQLLSPVIEDGWVKVKHHGGLSGYIRSRFVWGLR